MALRKSVAIISGTVALTLAAAMFSKADDTPADQTYSDLTCLYFGNKHDQLAANKTTPSVNGQAISLNQLTSDVVAQLPPPPGGSRTGETGTPSGNTIDINIFQALSDAGVQPAAATSDWEFIRRATLDLTGRIPTPTRVLAFVNDSNPNKRSSLADELIASPSWIDKWTVFFGDHFQNNSRNSQIVRYVPSVVGFNNYLRASLSSNKPYDQMARELISAQGTNSYTQGELNFIVGGVVTGGPQQDIWDQETANTVETFLGIAHVNCLLCHNGRGHLDTLSLWGSQQSRLQAWGMASFLSHTDASRTPVNGAVNNMPYYWGVADGVRYKSDYALNTTTGNRPPRQPIGPQTTVTPAYMFTGEAPKSGENRRAAFARILTSDRQFARATVNYMWEYFFGIGIVSPSNQFDPMRLDANNPPSGCAPNVPCTLQPSNPALLEALSTDFIKSGYDLKGLMREIVNSRTYQLSSRYSGTWNASWETLFARKLVRRLWGEEIHDAISQSSNILSTYTNADWGPTNWAMQFPEPMNTPDGGAGPVAGFLDAFLRGNRDDQTRKPDGSIAQTLGLMNDPIVNNRIRSNGPATSLLVKNLPLPDDQLVNTLFINVLSRYPTAVEMSAALANLKTNRNTEAENLLWSLYNKVDFTFNY